MRLVEEEDQLRKIQVAHLGKAGIQVGQQPEKEGGIELRLKHQLVGREHVHDALSSFALEEVIDVEGRLAEELLGALVLQGQQGALDGAHTGRGHVAIGRGKRCGIFGHIVQHRPQVLHIQQQKAAVIGNLEHDIQDAGLRFVQFQQAAQQLRSHVGNRGPHRVSLFAEHIEKPDRTTVGLRMLDAEFRQPFLDKTGQFPRLADTREVAFHIGHETRHAGLAEGFREDLEGDRFTGTRGTGYQTVAVRHFPDNADRAVLGVGYVQPAFLIEHTIPAWIGLHVG